MNMEYHKGYPCVYKPILCQEGFCSNCAVYFEKSKGKACVIEKTSVDAANNKATAVYFSLSLAVLLLMTELYSVG